jgi:signal transduction histidine kinase
MALPVILEPAGAPDDTFKRYGKGQERGLLLAGALVEAHGGQLRVASAGENRGVTVTVGLPLPSD